MKRGWRWFAPAAIVFAATFARAMFEDPPEAPVTRLLKNIARELEKTPDDPHVLYLAGRTHAIAYAMGEDAKARAWPADGSGRTSPKSGLPEFGTRDYDLLRFKGEASEVRFGHLRDGIRLLRRASELAKAPAEGSKTADDRPLLFLGLAWLLDDGSRFAPKFGNPDGIAPKDELPETERKAIDADIESLAADSEADRKQAFADLRKSLPRCWPRLVANATAKQPLVRKSVGELLTRWWRDQALDAYRKAFALTREGDLARADHRLYDTYSIAREAAEAILRLLDDFPSPDARATEEAALKADLTVLSRPPFAITPMIFPISRAAPLADLLAAHRTARFDLAGDGVVRRWPWPSADAGFLVWSPEGGKPVTSGRQLFGARTWWIFWRDRNCDGVCDAGEVESAAAFGVAWIAVKPTRKEDGIPANDQGIGLTDGSTRPTYDWTPRSIPEAPERE